MMQATEIAEVAKGWGDQLPALALGLLGMAALVFFFLRHLSAKDTASEAARVARDAELKAEREARDALFTGTIREVSARADETAKVCHATQAAATDRERETAAVLGSVRTALERSATVTQDVGLIAKELAREMERRQSVRAA